jgi:starvation-inducible DNA-binding protein
MVVHHPAPTKDAAQIKAFPSPNQLATPTDLNSQEVQAITEAVNPLIADSLALYVKTKNFHWHLASSHFRDYHMLFDEQADSVLESVDLLAERVRRIGGTTIRSISHVSQLQTIADDNDEFVLPADMIRRLMEDNGRLAKAQRAACEVCEKSRDYATANVLQNIVDETEKRRWFLFEVIQGANNTD